MPEMTPEEVKTALKEAMREWLDDKFTDLGVWTFKGFVAMLLAATMYFLVKVK